MAISDTQKVDYLWKKIGYGISKTDTDVGKKAYEETIASPLLLRGDIIWQKSIDIPGTLPTANTSIITVYKDGSGSWSGTVECTEDATATDNKSWKTNLTNWIGVEFGATYQVQVYIATSGVNNPQTSGTKIFAAGSGNNDEWFFDYQSGVLHFIGTTLPTAIATGITGKSIYVSGARYTGPTGFNISSSDSSNTQVLYNNNGNFAGSSSFTFNNSTNTITANNFVASSTANLGAVGNITITGGTSGQYLTTNGTGVVSWATVDSYRISNGTTQVYTYNNGNVAISAEGNSNVVVITGTGITVSGAISASSVSGTFTGSIGNGTSNITFPVVNGNINLISGGVTTMTLTSTGANITGYANITGNLNAANITRDNKNVITFVSASTKPSNPSLGDSWYNTTTDKTYQYIYDGTTFAWVDISSGFMLASTLANASSLVYRDANANIYANNFSGNTITIAGTGVSNIGNVGNLRITGGTSGYVLRTDGAGNLSWISPSSAAGGADTQVLFNDGGSSNGNSSLTFSKITGLLTTGNLTTTNDVIIGGNLTVSGATEYFNVTSTVVKDPIIELGGGTNAAALTTNDSKDRGTLLHYYTTKVVDAFMGWDNSNAEFAFGSNVSVSGEVVTFNTFGNVRAGYLIGDGSQLTGVAKATSADAVANGSSNVNIPTINGNVTVAVGGTSNVVIITGTGVNIAGTLNTGTGNANIGNIGTTRLLASANITAPQLISNVAVGTAPLIVTSTTRVANLNVSYANVSDYGAVTTQSTGTYYPTFVNGSSTANYALASNTAFSANIANGALFATTFVGNLIGLQANGNSNVSIPTANGNVNISAVGNANILVVTGTGVNVAGTLNTGTGNANVGNLGVTTDVIIGGNLIVNGTTTTVNSTTTRVVDPIVEQGGGANGAALLTNDSKDRGTLLHYYTGSTARDAFIGWDNSNAEFAFGSNVSVSAEVVTFNTLGNVRAGNFIGNVTGSATTVTASSQPNITSVGTLTSLTVTANVSAGNVLTNNLYYANGVAWDLQQAAGSDTQLQFNTNNDFGASANLTFNSSTNLLTVLGNVTSGNANLGNLVTANYFSGNGSLLTGLPAGYANSNVAAYLPTYTGNVSANYFIGNGSTLTTIIGANVSGNVTSAVQSHYANIANSVVGSNVSGQVGNALVAGTVYTNAQPNITSLGTLSSLIVAGTSQLGSLGSVKITGGLPDYVLKTDGTGNLSWVQVDTNPAFTGASYVSVAKDIFTASNATTISYTLSMTPSSESAIVVNIDGLVQLSDTYSLSGAVLTFGEYLKQYSQVEITMYGIVSIAGANTQVQYNNSGAFDSSANFTFNSTTNTLSANKVNVTEGPLTINGSTISVTNGVSAGIFNVGTPNISMGALSGNVTIGSSTGNVTLKGTVNISELSSNRASIAVTTDTLIDSFLVTKYRTAKYLISAESSAGYESVEVLLIHDGTNSYITTYGAISSVGYDDMITLTSNINGGNVCLYASNVYSSTNVNLLSTYVKV